MSTAPAVARDGFPALIDRSRDRLTAILPEGFSPERFAKIALVAYSQSPELKRCRPESILLEVMKAAELGLEIGKPLDLCHLVPFGGECTLLVDYKGMLELARRTGEFLAVDARVVHDADAFELHYDPTPVFFHRPHLGADRGQPTHVYAYARLRSGELQFEIMTVAEVEAIRRGARSANSPAWKNHYGEMARKVALKRLLKRLPRSPHLARAVELDDAGYDPDRMHVSGPPRTGPKSARLADQLERRALPRPEPEFTADEGVAAPLRTEDDDPTQEELDADADA